MPVNRWILPYTIILVAAGTSAGDLILIDEHIDAQQKTEIRYNLPDGCVLTGLGFRAAYDNITTMHCRYHRLTGQGKLTEPKEVRLGSEPDHDCEAKVLLPDGWLAVGFGAAGEPEWDVTLLRVWARPLRADGTLGELKEFSNGFKPDRGCERQVILTQSDRAITGAGLRFGQNDITGLYLRSARLFNLDDRARRNLRNFKERAWLIDANRPLDIDRLQRDIQRYRVTRLDVRADADWPALTTEADAPAISPTLKTLAARVPITCLWITSTDSRLAEKAFRRVHGLNGLVVDLDGVPPDQLDADALRSLAAFCRKADRQLQFRMPTRPSSDRGKYLALVRSMPPQVGLIEPLGPAPLSDLAELAPRRVIIEFDLAQHKMGNVVLPDVAINQMAGAITKTASAGAKGFILPINPSGAYLPETLNAMSLDALHRLAEDPLQPTAKLRLRLCLTPYSLAAEQASNAIQRTASINDLIFNTLGRPVLWSKGTILPFNAADRRLRRNLDITRATPETTTLRALLDPNDRTIKRATEEKETALWLLKQSISDAEAAVKSHPTAEARALVDTFKQLQSAAVISRDLTDVYLRTKMYAFDGAPSTRASVQAAMNRIRNALAAMPAEQAGSLPKDAEIFMFSVEQSLAKSQKSAVLPTALSEVGRLSEQGRDEQAVTHLVEIMNSNVFAPHLSKQNHLVGRLASSLKVLGGPSDSLQAVRGGDGTWTIEKVAGRWCYVIGPKKPCLYLDVPGPPLKTPADYVLSFEFYDKGDWKLHFEYDSDYPPEQKRQYHPVEPLPLTDTGLWLKGWFDLTNCLFSSGQNNNADMRFVSGNTVCIRNIKLERRRR